VTTSLPMILFKIEIWVNVQVKVQKRLIFQINLILCIELMAGSLCGLLALHHVVQVLSHELVITQLLLMVVLIVLALLLKIVIWLNAQVNNIFVMLCQKSIL
jgi:hypothetical protein